MTQIAARALNLPIALDGASEVRTCFAPPDAARTLRSMYG